MAEPYLNLIGLTRFWDKVKEKIGLKVDKADIVADLNTDDDEKPLAASMGKLLDENKVSVSDIVANLNTDDDEKPLAASQGKALADTRLEGRLYPQNWKNASASIDDYPYGISVFPIISGTDSGGFPHVTGDVITIKPRYSPAWRSVQINWEGGSFSYRRPSGSDSWDAWCGQYMKTITGTTSGYGNINTTLAHATYTVVACRVVSSAGSTWVICTPYAASQASTWYVHCANDTTGEAYKSQSITLEVYYTRRDQWTTPQPT